MTSTVLPIYGDRDSKVCKEGARIVNVLEQLSCEKVQKGVNETAATEQSCAIF